MPYLFRSQVPELSGFNRRQQRLLIREALILLKRDDPWFSPAVTILNSAIVGFAVFSSMQLFALLTGPALWFVGGATVATVVGFGGALCHHVLFSHLRPFLRSAIDKYSSELEAIP
jgi:hypothetical protein